MRKFKEKFDKQTLMGIDYGTKFTGISIHRVNVDPLILPFDRIPFESDAQLVREICTLIDNECIDAIILGVPYYPDGNESAITKKVLAFKSELSSRTSLPIFEQDESFSTFEASERMKNDPRYNFKVDTTKIDALAASIILEEFINS